MAFQADQKIKMEIVRCLGTEQLFRLLSDPDNNVLMKTLGLLRNLLSTRPVRNTVWRPEYKDEWAVSSPRALVCLSGQSPLNLDTALLNSRHYV